MRKKLGALFLIVSLAAGSIGCGNQGVPADTDTKDNTNNVSAEETNTPPAEQAGGNEEKVKLRVLSIGSDETQLDVMENFIKKNITEEYPNLEVEWETGSDLSNLVKTYSATGDLPDVWYSDAAYATGVITAGNQQNLSDYIQKDGFMDRFANQEALRYSDGGIYALSSGADTFYTPVVYYNKEIFDQYGLEEPQTFEELKQVCQKLIDAGIVPMSVQGQNGWTLKNFALLTLVMNEDPAVAEALLKNKTDFTDPVVLDALKKFEELVQMGAFPEGVSNIDYGTQLSLFTEGQTAMLYTMSWAAATVEEALDAGIFMWPASGDKVKTGDVLQIWGSPLNGWAVNAKSEQLAWAVKLAEYCCEQEAARHAQNGSSLNFQTGIEGDITLETEKERMQIYNQASKYIPTIHQNAMDSATVAEFMTYTNLMFTGSYSAEQFVEDFNPIWKSNTWFE